MASRYTSTPMDERTFLKHPMEGVTGGVHTGGAGYLQMAPLRPTQPGRTDMVPGHLRPFRLMEFPDPRQRDTDSQVDRWVPGTRSGTWVIHCPTCLRDYRLRMVVIQVIRPCHSPTCSLTWHRGSRLRRGGILVNRQFHSRRWRTCALTTRTRELRTLERLPGESASRQGKSSLLRRNSSKKTCRRSISRDSSDSSSSNRHRRSRKRKDKKHKKKSRHQQHGGSSDASLDRNWCRKDKGRTLNVSKLSSEDSETSSESQDGRRGRRAPPLPKLPTFNGKQPDWQGFLFQFRELAQAGKWSTREKHDLSFGLPERESHGLHPELAPIWTAWLLHSARHIEQTLWAGGAAYHCRKTASVPETRGNRDAGWLCGSSPHQGRRWFPRCQWPSAPRAGSGELSEGMPWQGCSIQGRRAESWNAQWSHAGPQISVCQLKGLRTF